MTVPAATVSVPARAAVARPMLATHAAMQQMVRACDLLIGTSFLVEPPRLQRHMFQRGGRVNRCTPQDSVRLPATQIRFCEGARAAYRAK